MKHLPFKQALLAALVAFSFAVFADPPVVTLNGVTGTTSTSALQGASGGPVNTGNANSADVQVWSTAGGTFTVLLEERASSGAPWMLVATMANCGADGNGTVTPLGGSPASGPCSYSTLAPKSDTRLRVSARSSGTIYGAIHVNRRQP